MDISKSDKPERMTCEFMAFSGLPNPEWPINRRDVPAIRALLDQLPERSGMADIQSILGYQGCRLRVGETRYEIYREVVRMQSSGNTRLATDESRQLEKRLLKTAPAAYAELIEHLTSNEF